MASIERICETCAKKFYATAYQIKIGTGKFCSHTCAGLAQQKRSVEERFWEKVNISEDDNVCWVWTAYCNPDGYGMFSVSAKDVQLSHRIAYKLSIGDVDSSERVLHTCDNPPCCNPKHLIKGTQADNIKDMMSKGRHVALKGEQHAQAKLNEKQIKEIIERKNRGEKIKDLALEFNVHKNTIYNILEGYSWKHL